MALIVSNITRKFVFEKNDGSPIQLSDVNGLSPEDVMQFYAGQYPELTTAVVEGPHQKGEEVEYRFVTKLGTKG